ncbi:MAG TPA: hypothetical protein VEJ20_09020, partial [Candidatus Eremiobacteraceae bacterium]|nr:hypothetical protein [Candidatus Eremiobacteraceae bacterium]
GANAITRGPDGSMWILSSDSVGRVTDGGVIRYAIPLKGLDMITPGPDGNLWLAVEPRAEGTGEWEDIGKFTLGPITDRR